MESGEAPGTKPFSTNKEWEEEGPTGSCLAAIPPFCDSLHPAGGGGQAGTGKGRRLWLEESLENSAGALQSALG